MAAALKEKKPDEALQAGLRFIFDTLDKSAKPLPTPVAGAVKDHAGFFRALALAKASEAVKEIKEKSKLELTVETLPRVPPGKMRQVAAMKPEARTTFFRDWVKDRAREAGATGAWVLICKRPRHVHVSLGADAVKSGRLDQTDRTELQKLLSGNFKEKAYDQGLLAAVTFVGDIAHVLPIKDEAGFFKADAVTAAQQKIKDIRRRFHKDVLIETFAEVPAERARGVDLNDKEARAKLFADWVADRQKSAGVDGINVLICKTPMHLRVGVGRQTEEKLFTPANRDKLVALLKTRFDEKNYDAGLADSLDYIAQAFKQEPTSAQKSPQKNGAKSGPIAQAGKDAKPKESFLEQVTKKRQVTFDPMWIVWGVVILLGLWIVIGLLRAMFGRGKPNYPPQYPPQSYPPQQPPPPGYRGAPPPAYSQGRPPAGGPPPGYGAPGYAPGYAAPPPPAAGGGGGGGFLPSLLGGMFGAAAGGWLYDKFSGRSASPPSYGVPGPAHSPHAAVGQSAPAPATPEYSSTGGDFGTPAAAPEQYASSGGDFGDESRSDQAVSSSGGDFGEAAAPSSDVASSGGDFGQQEETAASSGGDFGSEPAETASQGGGDWGGTDSGGGADTGGAGADFGGSTDAGGGGGDFGGGGADTGGGGGDFGGGGGDSGGGGASDAGAGGGDSF
jgi:uncharacterized membrane protein YgcG